MKKVNNIVRIPTAIDNTFFRYWLEFLRPFHKLTSREMEVVASMLKFRYELSKDINIPDVLDKVVMGEDVKKKVMEDCDINVSHFQVIMGKLKKSLVIVDGKLNPRFIPNVEKDAKNFQMLLYFDFK